MPSDRPAASRSTRSRILDAADALARSDGPGHLSLDAVAQKAGVSKGGLLYHFPTKTRLLEALVEEFLAGFDTMLRARETDARKDVLISAYVDLFLQERRLGDPPPSGLLAALAEDPELLAPVRRYERDFLDRIRANASDPSLATFAFLAVHGIRAMELLNVKVVTEDEIAGVVNWLKQALDEEAE